MCRTRLGVSAVAVLAVALAGCATRTPVSGKFPPITPRQAQTRQYRGTTVRWGGILIATTPESGRTCFRVMGLPLAADGRPSGGAGELETGRFIACARGFFDPMLYAAGRQVTFVGTIAGIKIETVGNYRYPYPEIDARIVYLWPKEAPAAPMPAYYGPYYWGPWGPWGSDWWWNPWNYWPPAYDRDHRRRRRTPPPPPPANGKAPPAAAPHRPLPGMKVRVKPPVHLSSPPAHAAPSPPPARPVPKMHPVPVPRPSSGPPPRMHPPPPRTRR